MQTNALVGEPLTWEEYCAKPGLSHSAMKDLAVSPLRFWYRHLRPDREPEEPTPEMQIGSALHCAVLEPKEFDRRYACELLAPEGCLVTIEDLRNFIRSRGGVPKGTRKIDVVQQVAAIDPDQPIFDVLETEYQVQHAGKTIFKLDAWQRIAGAAEALMNEPRIQEILRDGVAEVAMFRADPDTGVVRKGRMDWVTPGLTLDLKTFSQRKGDSIERSIHRAIWQEGYHTQAWTYAFLRGWPDWRGQHLLAFVESDPPHEVRLVSLRERNGREANLYWTRAMLDVRELTRRYAECMTRFGVDKPWRVAQAPESLCDEDLPQLVWQ
jgi:hypothetical protein